MKEQILEYLKEAYPSITVAVDGHSKLVAWHMGVMGINSVPEILIFKPFKGHIGLALETDHENKNPMYEARSIGWDGYFISSFYEAKMIIDRHLN